MGTLLRSCAEMHEAIELSFEVVSRVGSGIHVLYGCIQVCRILAGSCSRISTVSRIRVTVKVRVRDQCVKELTWYNTYTQPFYWSSGICPGHLGEQAPER